ncbi:MAG: PEP-CTERM sorting domain-containing protein [Thiobacillus sp.]|nr:PEP-CTERM sorting domain-containing protein [Thiobacillus sp.]
MNKKLALLALGLFSLNGAAQAALHDRGGGLIYDDDLNVTWLQDANYAQTSGYTNGPKSWSIAATWVANLSYYDSVRDVTYTDWRLPSSDTCVGICFNGEMGHLYYDELGGVTYGSITAHHNDNYSLFRNLYDSYYWTSTEYVPNTGIHMIFTMGSGLQDSSYDFGPQYYAMAVRFGDVAAIPEPETYAMMLAGLGLLGFAVHRRKQKGARGIN